MANYFPDQALKDSVDDKTGTGGQLKNAVLHLFVTNHANDSTDDITTYDAIEATAGGYAAQTITDWGAAVVTANVAVSTAGVYTFTFTGAGLPTTVYGAYVKDANGDLAYADLIATGGVTISAAGQTYSYRPKYSEKNA